MAVATLAIAGCAQNEITEMNPDANAPIGFGVYTGVQTKGTETTVATIQTAGTGFGVMALKGSSLYTNAERNVTYNTSITSWTYSNPMFWPADGANLTFYAYAPYGATGITNSSFNTTTPKIDFTVQAPANMVDLVVANQTAGSGTVNLSFAHVLSRIAFTGSVSTDISGNSEVKAFITKLEVLRSSTTFYKTGTYDFATDAWSNTTNFSGESYDIVVTDTETEVTNTTHVALEGIDYLFCIPVAKSSDTSANAVLSLNVSYKTVINNVESENIKTVTIPVEHLRQGVAYKYNFAIGLNDITFNVTDVAPWGNATEHSFSTNS